MPDNPLQLPEAHDPLADLVASLAELAKRVQLYQEAVRHYPRLLLLVAEVCGLLDTVCSLYLTNPEDRALGHVNLINQIMEELHNATPTITSQSAASIDSGNGAEPGTPGVANS